MQKNQVELRSRSVGGQVLGSGELRETSQTMVG